MITVFLSKSYNSSYDAIYIGKRVHSDRKKR